jgi:hypothetical protein
VLIASGRDQHYFRFCLPGSAEIIQSFVNLGIVLTLLTLTFKLDRPLRPECVNQRRKQTRSLSVADVFSYDAPIHATGRGSSSDGP